MKSKISVVVVAAFGWLCAQAGLPTDAFAGWNCAKCHGVNTPSRAPSRAQLDKVSDYSEWQSQSTATVGKRYVASFTYAVKCQVTATQYVETYPEDAARRDYVYLYNPQSGTHWARCLAKRPEGAKAEWSLYVKGKGWVANSQAVLKIQGVGREVTDPPLPPLE